MKNNNLSASVQIDTWPDTISNRFKYLSSLAFWRQAWPIVIIGLMTLGLIFWVYSTAHDDWRVIAANAEDSQKQEILAALEKEGIEVSLDEGSGAIKVHTQSYQKAKIILASGGLSKSRNQNQDSLGQIEMGTSRAVENVRLRQSLENDLEKSITEISIIEAARVLIAVPDASPFIEEQAPITASVIIRLKPGRVVSEEQIRAILNIVASAVPGLSQDHVSIADQTGDLLSDTQNDPSFLAAYKQLMFKKKMEEQISKRIRDILEPLAGNGNYSIAVNADIDFDQKETTREKVDPQSVLRIERTAKNSDNISDSGGIPGATTNIPAPAAQIGEQSTQSTNNNQSLSENSDKGYEVGREISNIKSEVGRVRRLSVAVVLRSGGLFKNAKDINVIKDLIKSASGYDQNRNDVLTVQVKKFAPVQSIPAESFIEKYEVIDRSPYWLTVIGVAMFSLLVLRQLKVIVKKISRDSPKEQSSDGILHHEIPSLSAPRDYEDKIKVIRDFANHESDRATAVMRQLLAAPQKIEQ